MSGAGWALGAVGALAIVGATRRGSRDLPLTWFHGTSSQALPFIEAHGLKAMGAPGLSTIRAATEWYRRFWANAKRQWGARAMDDEGAHNDLLVAVEDSGIGNPMVGFVYLARDLGHVLTRDSHGTPQYAVEVRPDPGCLVPDEDWLGRVLAHSILHPKETWWQEDLSALRDAELGFLVAETAERLGAMFRRDLDALSKFADEDDWRMTAPVGKEAIGTLTNGPEGRALLSALVHHAPTAAIRVSGAGCNVPNIVRFWTNEGDKGWTIRPIRGSQ